MHINKTSSCFMGKGPGAEPGVDVRRDSAYLNFGHIRQNCLIEVADYSSVRSNFARMTNVEFINFLNNTQASEREPWVKVRWINVGGISWDVIRALGFKYGMADLPPSHVTLSHLGLCQTFIRYPLRMSSTFPVALVPARTTTRNISLFVSSVTPSTETIRSSQTCSKRSPARLLRSPSNLQTILKACLRTRRRRIRHPDLPPPFPVGSKGPTSPERSNREDTTCKT